MDAEVSRLRRMRLDYPERGEAVVNPSTAAADSLPRVLPRVTEGFGDS